MINLFLVLIILSSIIVVISRQIEISVFSLILTFALSGVFFILIGVPLFGFIYLIVYTAAISILFLFVIMMLDIPKKSSNPLPLILILLAFIPLVYSLDFTTQSTLQKKSLLLFHHE
eukprot:NODE_706_length_4578_cov_0.202277.p2 type:complete len:117 gc:universal NODE_706_length_4578_cov_0.202277:1578-1928(+)